MYMYMQNFDCFLEPECREQQLTLGYACGVVIGMGRKIKICGDIFNETICRIVGI